MTQRNLQYPRLLQPFITVMFVILLLPGLSLAQLPDIDKQASEEQDIEYFVDYASFQAQDDQVVFEVYLLIPRNQLSFVKSDSLDRYVARGFVQVGLAQSDSIRYLDRWSINDSAENLEDVRDTQSIPDATYFKVPEGRYNLIVQVIDLNEKSRGLHKEPITLSRFDEDKLTISDIEFASMVELADEKTIFTKAKRNVVPNASLTFGAGTPVLYSYAEIYNFEHPAAQDSFLVQYSVLDLNNAEVKTPISVTRKKAGTSNIDIGGLNIIGLPSGIYFYRISVEDLASGEVATRSKKFYVYKPGEQTQPISFSSLAQDYGAMEEPQLDEVYDTMSPLLTGKEKRNYRKAGIEGKRNLLVQFWEKRDPDPSTEINELQIEYSNRLEYVKRNFGNQQIASHKSDRGRVYLLYGEPDEVERNPVGVSTKPHEIWMYHSIQGGVEFIFVDRTGFGQYQLVHSTARNELYDPNWRRFIETNPTSTF